MGLEERRKEETGHVLVRSKGGENLVLGWCKGRPNLLACKSHGVDDLFVLEDGKGLGHVPHWNLTVKAVSVIVDFHPRSSPQPRWWSVGFLHLRVRHGTIADR